MKNANELRIANELLTLNKRALDEAINKRDERSASELLVVRLKLQRQVKRLLSERLSA